MHEVDAHINGRPHIYLSTLVNENDITSSLNAPAVPQYPRTRFLRLGFMNQPQKQIVYAGSIKGGIKAKQSAAFECF